MGERYPPDINCREIENLPYLFENRCLTTLERGETLIAYCFVLIDLLAILQKSLDRAIFYTILHTRFDRVALELRSQLCTFENSTNCNEISFNPHSLSE